MEYVIYKDQAGYFRWTLYASNGKKIADSGEGYFNRTDCLHGINLVAGSTGTPIKDLS